MSAVCKVCKTSTDTRPYGVGGTPICFECMSKDPKRAAEARRQLGKVFRSAGVGGVVLLGPNGAVAIPRVIKGKKS